MNKLLEAKLGGFTSAEKVAEGQYRFRVGNTDRWVIWNGIPAGLSGSVSVTDLYGNESVMNAGAIATSEANPLIVSVSAGGRRRAARK